MPPRTVYYTTTTLCPTCEKLLPGKVEALDDGVFVTRTCPEHGRFEGLVCSDPGWFDSLPRFDVPPTKPARARRSTAKGCPADCGLCPAHRQSAGTTAIEISNRCNATCPVCLADNRGTFELSPAEVRAIVEEALRDQGSLDVVTLSGGEPTIHPRLFEILRELDRPEIGRIALNSNGLRLAEDDALLEELARHPKLYVSLHHDGPNAARLRGTSFEVQQRALDRLARYKIGCVPVMLAAAGVNDQDLGPVAVDLLRRPVVKSLILSLMAYTGERGGRFPGAPRTRLTIPAALDRIERGSDGLLRRADFMPLPMPNPICAAIGYFLVEPESGEAHRRSAPPLPGLLPLLPAAGVDGMVAHLQNAHFARPDERFEQCFRDMVDRVYADPSVHPRSAQLLRGLRSFLDQLFPGGRGVSLEERTALAEERIKTVYLMQFMDSWTFDSVRLSKCSCQHLLPDGVRIPSCGYYTYHRRFNPRFS
jgi:7,8-dihydro-6-hydroxymethylpterin dimethyltransferase